MSEFDFSDAADPSAPVDEPTTAEMIQSSMQVFLDQVSARVSDLCVKTIMVSESFIPFSPSDDSGCEMDEALCSMLWVRLVNVSPSGVTRSGFGGDSCAFDAALTLEVGIIRCFEVPEDGIADALEVTAAALQSVEDMQAILDGAVCSDVWGSLNIGAWSAIGPMGDQYGGTWTFTVTL